MVDDDSRSAKLEAFNEETDRGGDEGGEQVATGAPGDDTEPSDGEADEDEDP